MIEVYSRAQCVRCSDIKQFLSANKVQYTERQIGVDVQREEVLSKFPDQTNLPIITIWGDVIGIDELKTLVENKQLELFG